MDRKVIDRIKGVGAILVVFGHSFTYEMRDEYELAAILFNAIYSFHMPLFFVISGYLYSMPKKNEVCRYLKKKFIRLIIPYYFSILSVELIKAYLCGNTINYKLIIKELFLFTGNGWFLSTMFILLTLYTFTMYIIPNDIKKVNIVIYVVCIFFLLFIVNHVDFEFFRVNKVLLYLPYFVLGNILKERTIKKKKKILFFAMGVFISGNLMGFGLYSTPDYAFLNFLIALSGVYIVYYLFSEADNKVIQFFGENSMIVLTVPGLFISDVSFAICNKLAIGGGWQINVGLVLILQTIMIYFVTKFILSKNKGLAVLYGCRYIK